MPIIAEDFEGHVIVSSARFLRAGDVVPEGVILGDHIPVVGDSAEAETSEVETSEVETSEVETSDPDTGAETEAEKPKPRRGRPAKAKADESE